MNFNLYKGKKTLHINDVAFDSVQEKYYIFDRTFGIWENSTETDALDFVSANYNLVEGSHASLKKYTKSVCQHIISWNNRVDFQTSKIFFCTKNFLIIYCLISKNVSIIEYGSLECEKYIEALNRCSILNFTPCNFDQKSLEIFFHDLKNSSALGKLKQLEIICPNLFSFLKSTFSYYRKNGTIEDNLLTIVNILHALSLKSFSADLNRKITFQKIFCLVGPGRSGKSTFQNFLISIAGSNSCHSTTMDAVSSDPRFESFFWLDKSLILFNEVSFNNKNWTNKVVPLLKAASGNDLIPVEKKFGGKFNAYIPALFFLTSNENLPISYEGEFVSQKRRFVNFFFNKSVKGKNQDLELSNKLAEETLLFCLLTIHLFPNIFEK